MAIWDVARGSVGSVMLDMNDQREDLALAVAQRIATWVAALKATRRTVFGSYESYDGSPR